MHLTQFTDYSLRVLVYLGRHPDELSTIERISKAFQIPRSHLVKVVHQLSQKGLIEAFQGKNGGLRLAKPTLHYRIGDIVEATEPHLDLVECFGTKTPVCPIKGFCELENALHGARLDFLKSLNRYTLDTLVKSQSERAQRAANQFAAVTAPEC